MITNIITITINSIIIKNKKLVGLVPSSTFTTLKSNCSLSLKKNGLSSFNSSSISESIIFLKCIA